MIDCDILIAGSGVAGLSAALTAGRLGRSTVVVTGAVPGGQLLSINRIDAYPGFPDGVPGYDLDVTGDFSTSGRDRGSRAGGRWYAKQEVQAGDRQSAEADRGGGGQR